MSVSIRSFRPLFPLALAVALIACENRPAEEGTPVAGETSQPEQTPAQPTENPLEAPPIDTARIGSVEQIAAWKYRREASADLDGDNQPERVVIVSDAEMSTDGKPLWEDGHRWAVYAESASGQRTLLYGGFVPNGFVEAALLAPDNTKRRKVLVQERTPQQLRALEIEYVAPGSVRLSSGAHYQLGEWLPGSAAMP